MKHFTHFKSSILRGLLSLFFLTAMASSAWGETVTYTVTSKNAVSTSGTAPQGSSASYSQTYNNAQQMTKGNSTTLTLSGFDGCTITEISVSTKTNASTGDGSFSVNIGGTQKGSLSVSKLGSTYISKKIPVNSTKVGSGETIVITGNCTTNSVYCESYTITYIASGKTALGTPSNLSSSNITGSSAQLSWDKVSNASSYKVKVGSTEYDASSNSLTVDKLDEKTQYNWSVKALAGSSESYSDGVYSSESSFTTGNFEPTAGTYDIVPNNKFFNCESFTSKPSDFTTATGTQKGVTIDYIASSNAYINNLQCRMYNGTKLKFTAPTGFVLNKIAFTAEGSEWRGTHSATSGSMTNYKTWEGSATSVTITFGDNCRCTKITVTYSVQKELQSISISGTPTKKNYEAGEAFNPAGLKVTGTYNTGDETITEGIQWTLNPETLSEGDTQCEVTARVGEVTSKSYKVTGLSVINANATKYSVNLNSSSYATLSADPTSAAEGATVTLSYSSVAEHYHFVSWSVINGETPVTVTDNKFTMPSGDVTVSATFEEDAKHYATFSVNGETTKSLFYENETIVFPTNVSVPTGMVLTGWYNSEYSNSVTAPHYVTNAVMGNEDVTYYAVFATEKEVNTIETTLKETKQPTSGYKSGDTKDSNNETWTYYASINNQSGTLCFALNSNANNYNIGSPKFNGKVKSISLKAYNGSSSKDRKLYICSSNSVAQPTSGDLAEITIAKSEQFSNTYNVDLSDAGSFDQFYIYAAEALSISQIDVSYSIVNYSNFCTSVESIAISSAGYATYVTSNALDFSNCAGIEAFKAMVDNDQVLLKSVTEVPSATAIVVKGAEGNYNVPVIGSTEEDFSDNQLNFSTEKKVVNQANKYYVLANQNGKICFAPVAVGSSIGAKKGYIELTGSGAASLRIVIDDFENGNETGMPEIDDNGEVPLIIYTMTGVRIPKVVEDGLYIVNGKTKWMIAE